MKINPVNNSYNVSMHGNWWRKPVQRIFNALPEYTQKESEKSVDSWNKFNKLISDPMTNRGIIGATAVITQPVIDYYNHKVDEETRVVSRNRTLAKIAAGTLVGMFVVRGPIYKMVEKMTDVSGTSKFSTALLPKAFINEMQTYVKRLHNYRSAVSMGLALAAMTITNFALDAPLTKIFTNHLNKRCGIKTPESKDAEVRNG